MKTILKKSGIRYRYILLPYILLAAITAAAAVYMNLLSGQMSDAAVRGDVEALTRFVLLITGVLLLRAVTSAVSAVILAKFNAGAGFKLRSLFFNHFMRVPFAELEKSTSGENLSVYSNDIPLARGFYASASLGLVAEFFTLIAALGFMIFISPQFTGVLVLAAIGMLVVQLLLSLPIQRWGVRMSEEEAKFNAVVNDSLQNLSVVSAYSLEGVVEKRYMDAYNKFLSVVKSFAKALALSAGTMMAVLFSPLVVIVVVLALATIDGNMTLIEFIAFSTTIMALAGGIMGMSQGVAGLARHSAGAMRLNDVTKTADGTEDGGLRVPVTTSGAGAISFTNVSFSYTEDGDTKALDDVTFTIQPGSKVAIVGGSGSGKSTILKLLLGLYQPTAGEISTGGQDMAYVPQDSFLFPKSIGKNISLEDNPDPARLRKACEEAEIFDFIDSLPDKFDGVLTEAAENVSGGQRQRIAMARAFYKNADVILFDEATASLDPATEAAVLKSLDTAAAGKTVIIVAHREAAISHCDHIITLEGGKIV